LLTESTRRKTTYFYAFVSNTKRKMRIQINTGILNRFIISVLWKQEFHYCIRKGPPPVPVLNQS